MSTKEALDEYDNVAKRIFRKSNRNWTSLDSQFNEQALEEAIRELVDRRRMDQRMRDPNNHPTTGLSVVCSLPTTDQRQPYRFRGYPHPGRNDIHDFGKDCMIWEAARATTAAPTFFKPITITNGSEKKDFLDAALSFNNPTGEILKEAAEILEPTRELGCVLTLGTGTRAKSLERPASCSLLGIRWVFTKLIPALKSHTTDSERVHSDYEERFTDFKDSYFRFNLPDGADAVKLHQYKKMDELKEMTRKYLQTNPEARRNMDRLVSVLAKRRTQGLTVGLACRSSIIARIKL